MHSAINPRRSVADIRSTPSTNDIAFHRLLVPVRIAVRRIGGLATADDGGAGGPALRLRAEGGEAFALAVGLERCFIDVDLVEIGAVRLVLIGDDIEADGAGF